MPGISSSDQWLEWCKNPPQESCTTSHSNYSADSIDSSAIPAMLRRRLSPMGRAATSCLMPLLSNLNNSSTSTPIIFASRHGETSRTHKMLTEIAANELLSPTAFSLSVHNAICGIISINQKVTANITAIAANGDELMATLTEALGLLNSSDCSEVLCVLCDTPLPDNYQSYCQQPHSPYALAFTISKHHNGTPISIECATANTALTTPPTELQALQFIRLLCGQKPNIQLTLGASHWSVSRPC